MTTTAKYLWILASCIFVLLGLIHLIYTFFTDKFSTSNQDLIRLMKENHPKLTKKTSIWRSWIGFNASHSAGAIFIGAGNLILAIESFEFIQNSFEWKILTIITVTFYCYLGRKYWFSTPFIGISLSCLLYLIAIVLIVAA